MQHLEDPYDRFRRQFQRIQQVFSEPYGDEPAVEFACDDMNAPSYAYDRDHLLVAETELDFVRQNINCQAVGDRPAYGPRLVRADGRDAKEVLDQLRGLRQDSPDIGLNHLITVADDVNLCPADEPIPAGQQATLVPAATGGSAGDGVYVRVIDTGLVPDYQQHAWLADLEPSPRWPVGKDDPIPLDYGHGTFVAGVLRTIAPKATVRVSNDFQRAGGVTECKLRDALARVLEESPQPDIVSISAGGTSEAEVRMSGLDDVVTEIIRRGIVLVAAAGNNGNSRRFFPAALPGVISVGALREEPSAKACFSNYGEWVSLYAPGERLVNAFTTHGYVVQHKGRETCLFRRRGEAGWYACCSCVTTLDEGQAISFSGLARWSGTSFATPIVAGLIAARKSLAGGTARQAADWLLNHPHQRIEGLGPAVIPGQPLECRSSDPDCGGDC